jgi:DNA-binding NarL/FixJ family response regulator
VTRATSSWARTADGTVSSGLTTAEQRVLGVLCQGKSNKEIALELECSIKTVEFHMSNILRKTGAGSRTHLLASQLEASKRENLAKGDGMDVMDVATGEF